MFRPKSGSCATGSSMGTVELGSYQKDKRDLQITATRKLQKCGTLGNGLVVFSVHVYVYMKIIVFCVYYAPAYAPQVKLQ